MHNHSGSNSRCSSCCEPLPEEMSSTFNTQLVTYKSLHFSVQQPGHANTTTPLSNWPSIPQLLQLEHHGSLSFGYKNFQDTRSIFPGPCPMPVTFKYKDKQQLLWGPGHSPGRQQFFVYTDKIGANFHKFWHQQKHHCVCFPHHSLENSRTNPCSRTFQGLEILQKEIQDFPGDVGTVEYSVFTDQMPLCSPK